MPKVVLGPGEQSAGPHAAGHVRGHVLGERGQALVGAGDPQHVLAWPSAETG